ncbi:MAG: GNAT family N-acetyltransferase, partial [Fluviicola sp.]
MEKSPNIELRLVEESDADLIFSWENNREVWPVTGTRYEYSLLDIHTYIEQSQNINEFGQIRFIIVDSDSKKSIGTIDLYDYSIDNKRAAVGVLIAEKEYRGKGCA